MNDVLQYGFSAASLLWMVGFSGWAVMRLLERPSGRGVRWHQAWIAGAAASAVILYVADRYLGFGWAQSVLACTVGGIVLLALAGRRRGNRPQGPADLLGRGATVAAILVGLTLATPYLEWATHSDIYANTITDWNDRQSAIWAIQRFGLPLQDPSFYPGRSVPLYYNAGAYLAVAAAAEAGLPGTPQEWPYVIFMAGAFVALAVGAGDLAARMFSSRRAGAWAVALLCVGGLDVLVNGLLVAAGEKVSLGHVGAWADSRLLRIDSLYAGMLWGAPHAIAAAVALVLARSIPLGSLRQWRRVLAAGILLAGMFLLSPYVTAASGAILAAALGRESFTRRWRRLGSHVAVLGATAAVALALVVPFIRDLQAADQSGGRSKLVVGLPEASIHPASRLLGEVVGAPVDTAAQILVGILPVGAIGWAGWRLRPAGPRWRVTAGVLGLAVCLTPLMVLTVRSTGGSNDWGLRAPHLLQIAGAVLGAGIMARVEGRRPWVRAVIGAGLALGLMSTVWEIGTTNLGRYLTDKPPNRYELYQASRFVRKNTTGDAVLMVDTGIEGLDYARRWSDRRGLLPTAKAHGGNAYSDPQALAEVRCACRQAASVGLDAPEMHQLRAFGVTVALVRAAKLGGDVSADRILYRNEQFAVVTVAGP